MSRNLKQTSLLDSLRRGVGKTIAHAASWILKKSAGEQQLAEMIGGYRFGGYPGTWSGDRIEQVRHYRHWVYRAIDCIARQLATNPPEVGRVRTSDERKQYERMVRKAYQRGISPERVRCFLSQRDRLRNKSLTPLRANDELEIFDYSHPLVQLLRNPNDPDTGGDLWRELDVFLELNGISYLWPVPNGAGRIAEMWVIPSHWVYPVSEGKRRLVDYYEIRPYEAYGGAAPTTVAARYDASELIPFRFKGPLSKIDGHSPLQAGAEIVDVYESIQMSRYHACKNGSNIGEVIQLGEDYDVEGDQDMRRIEAKFFSKWQGERGFERPMILPAGCSLVRSPPERELAYLQSSDQLRDYIAAMWGVPKTVLGITEATNRATFIGAMAQFIYQTVNPRARYIGEVLSEKLAPYYGENIRIWWPDMTPSDDDAMRADVQMLAQNLMITPNEGRAWYGLEPYENGGDDPIAPMGVSPIWINSADDGAGEEFGTVNSDMTDTDGLGDDDDVSLSDPLED